MEDTIFLELYIISSPVIIKFTFFMNTVQFKFILQNLNLVQFKFSIFLGIIIELSSVHLKKWTKFSSQNSAQYTTIQPDFVEVKFSGRTFL